MQNNTSILGKKGYESMAAQDALAKGAGALIVDPTKEGAAEAQFAQDKLRQERINAYNIDLENAHLDKRFQTKTFVGNSIIVKLEKFDYLTPSEVIEGAHIINPLYILNVATPDHPKGKTIANPLPYSYIGTVVAIGDEVKNYREKNGLMPIIPGDTVELTWFDLKEYRYYPDKNRLDWMTLDNPHAPNFEGFAKVPAQFVEAIVPAGMYEEVYGSRAERFNTMAETYTEADYRRSH